MKIIEANTNGITVHLTLAEAALVKDSVALLEPLHDDPEIEEAAQRSANQIESQLEGALCGLEVAR